ncbi:MAG: ABC transporter permease [Candidatus Aquicultorales bacterium]
MLSIAQLFMANLKMTFRNKQAMVWTFIMPIILMVLFGLAFGKTQSLSMKVGVVDQAKNDFSKQIVKGLEKVDAFKISKGTKDGELKALKEGDRTSVIILPKDFGSGPLKMIEAKKKAAAMAGNRQDPGTAGAQGSVSQGAPVNKVESSAMEVYYDPTNPNVTGTAKMVMGQVVSGMNQKINASPELFKIDEKEVTSRKYSNIDFFAAGIMSMFIMNGGVMTVIMILVGFRERGVLRRLNATPMSLSAFVGTQILVRVLIALLQMALLLGIAMVVFGAQVAGSPLLLSLIVVEGSLVFIALGFGIASFAQTNQTAMALGNIITMPMMFLSGVFFPTDSFPKFVQPLIKALPLTYLARALREVMMRGSGLETVARDMGILALFGLAIFGVSIKLFKWE